MPSIISASTTSTTALNFTADTSGVLALQTGATPTTAVTIDGSQNVGIGTSSPSGRLSVTTSTMTNQIIADSMSDSTTYGLVSLNASRVSTGYLGIAGGGGTDKTLFLNVPTGGKYSFGNNFSCVIT